MKKFEDIKMGKLSKLFLFSVLLVSVGFISSCNPQYAGGARYGEFEIRGDTRGLDLCDAFNGQCRNSPSASYPNWVGTIFQNGAGANGEYDGVWGCSGDGFKCYVPINARAYGYNGEDESLYGDDVLLEQIIDPWMEIPGVSGATDYNNGVTVTSTGLFDFGVFNRFFVCGNDVCESKDGETTDYCPEDCGGNGAPECDIVAATSCEEGRRAIGYLSLSTLSNQQLMNGHFSLENEGGNFAYTLCCGWQGEGNEGDYVMQLSDTQADGVSAFLVWEGDGPKEQSQIGVYFDDSPNGQTDSGVTTTDIITVCSDTLQNGLYCGSNAAEHLSLGEVVAHKYCNMMNKGNAYSYACSTNSEAGANTLGNANGYPSETILDNTCVYTGSNWITSITCEEDVYNEETVVKYLDLYDPDTNAPVGSEIHCTWAYGGGEGETVCQNAGADTCLLSANSHGSDKTTHVGACMDDSTMDSTQGTDYSPGTDPIKDRWNYGSAGYNYHYCCSTEIIETPIDGEFMCGIYQCTADGDYWNDFCIDDDIGLCGECIVSEDCALAAVPYWGESDIATQNYRCLNNQCIAQKKPRPVLHLPWFPP